MVYEWYNSWWKLPLALASTNPMLSDLCEVVKERTLQEKFDIIGKYSPTVENDYNSYLMHIRIPGEIGYQCLVGTIIYAYEPTK